MAELFDTYFIYAFWLCILYLIWCFCYACYSYWDVHERVRPATNPSKRIHVDVWAEDHIVNTLRANTVDTMRDSITKQKRDAKERELSALRDKLRGNKR